MKKVYGTEWNAMLGLVLNALDEDPSPLAKSLSCYLADRTAPPDMMEDIDVSEDLVNLVKYISRATTLTEMELSYVRGECGIILEGETA
jgi:hypothetical protein